MNTESSNEEEKLDWEFLRLAIIASDTENRLWPAEEVNKTKGAFLRHRGSIPSFAELGSQYGQHLEPMIQQILKDRASWVQFENQLLGTNSPCHSCGSTKELSHHNFWLARVTKKERDWKGSLISVAVSAVTVPLLGAGGLYGSTSKTGNLMDLRLVLCANCLERLKGIFGGFSVSARYAQMHPLWGQLQDAGFTEFLDVYARSKWN